MGKRAEMNCFRLLLSTNGVYLIMYGLLNETVLTESRDLRLFSITRRGIEQYKTWTAQMAEMNQGKFETTTNTYTMVKSIGQGAVGTVFEVTDTKSDVYALKLISESVLSMEKVKRFYNEIKFLTSSRNTNLVPVLDDGFITRNDKKLPFYVMPKYHETLRSLINKGIPHDQVLGYFADLLGGIEFLHLKKSWHRDLKPENVLYDATNNRLLVADLGAAHFAEDQLHTLVETKPDSRLANFEYAAPEQRRKGRKTDSRADIYALGLILNEMFTGEVLQGKGHKTIGEVSPAYEFLDELVDQMVQQHPERRPASVSAVKVKIDGQDNENAVLPPHRAIQTPKTPESDLADPLIQKPPKIENVEYANNLLTFVLDKEVTTDWWINFKNPGFPIKKPMNLRPSHFIWRENKLSIPCRENQVIPYTKFFDAFLPKVNSQYETRIKQLHANRQKKQQLSVEKAAARRRRETQAIQEARKLLDL